MYLDPKMNESIRKVESAREANMKLDPRRMTAEEKENLLKTFHPDYREDQFVSLRIGPNKGEKVPTELASLLEGKSRMDGLSVDLTSPDYETDVLIIGGGGAGCSAAIEANENGASVLLVTKLRVGDANTMMAEGGIQAADKPNDSPAQHFLDAYGGGHFAAQKDLLYKLVNAKGEVFMNPLETRDVSAAAIIRECTERGNGVATPQGCAVWLDTPMIEAKHGAGTIEKRIPAMLRMFAKHGIDIRREPILVYPTLHYQNGGLKISANGQTELENLYAAGEVVGGIHGRNRLMGNSLLDIIVFGRNAGKEASEKAKSVQVGELTLSHLKAYNTLRAEAGIHDDKMSPQLLPDYVRKENRGK